MNACINLGYWPSHFKKSSTVVISKPNKQLYDHSKSFHSIMLLNMLGKLIEKVIRERLQFQVTANNFIYPSQLGGLKFKSITNAGVALTHIIHSGWVKNLSTSTLAFNIVQFFLSLNYCFLTCILQKADIDSHIVKFFSNYLIIRKTNYMWNKFSSPMFKVNIGVGQGSALSLILSALYFSPFLYILENCLKNLNIPVSIILFVNDRLFISQNKSLVSSNSCLFCSYNVMTRLLDKFGLIIEHLKTEVFHFNRLHSFLDLPPLDLSSIGGPVLVSKNSWKYLRFIFDRKLSFYQYINYYSNRAISMVKYMRILGNSSQDIISIQKCLLYKCYILPITLYSFQLWFYNYTPLLYPLKILNKIQRKAAIWILGAFKISLSEGIEAIVGLIPIKLHLQNLMGRSQLHILALSPNHIICLLMDLPFNSPKCPHSVFLKSLTSCQRLNVKEHLVNSNNKAYGIFPSFSPLHPELSLGSRIIDNFSDQISFNLSIRNKNNKIYCQQLDNMVLEVSSSSSTAIVISDASVKNDIATSISHVHIANQLLIKILHHAVFVVTTKAELFMIRCSINQACSKKNISKIVVVTDSIHMAKKIFDTMLHPYQGQAVAILSNLCQFFTKNQSNSIEFWECPS